MNDFHFAGNDSTTEKILKIEEQKLKCLQEIVQLRRRKVKALEEMAGMREKNSEENELTVWSPMIKLSHN